MHLLAATPGSHDDGQEPVDLNQTPADVVVISAAATELAALSAARASLDTAPTLRLANLAHLRHPMSVDLHLDQCAEGSRLVVARILGGTGYWRYGVEQYAARLHAAGIPLALLPGDDKPDAELRALSTVTDADYDRLWSYLVEGGPENAANFLLRKSFRLCSSALRTMNLISLWYWWIQCIQPNWILSYSIVLNMRNTWESQFAWRRQH